MSKPKLAGFPNENDGDGRYYTNPITKERLPSVTSVLRMADKSQLTQWAVNLSVDWAVNNLDILSTMDVKRGGNMARYKWKDFRDERAQTGTGIHDTVEAEHTGSWEYPVLDDEQKLIMREWRKLNEKHDIKPIFSEFTVWNPGIAAGTADGYWTIDGVPCLVDIKTSKNTWPEHMYQLAALWKSPIRMEEYELDKWREVDAPQYDRVVLVHLRAPVFNEYGYETESGKHDIIEVHDLEENYRAFKAYADVWQAKQDLKVLTKKREAAQFGGF